MYINPAQAQVLLNSFEWSSGIRTVFWKFFISLTIGKDSLSGRLFSTIAEVLPIALTVAGAILVVNLGWRLFRNFTKG